MARRISHQATRIPEENVELYIMIHGVPFRLADLLNWLGNQLVTHRQEYLHGPPKSSATGGISTKVV